MMQNLFKTKLISIDPKRVASFKERNRHIPIDDERLGVKEENLDTADIKPIATRELAAAAQKERGSIGNAHSIFWTLKDCIAQKKHFLILEDDVTLHQGTIDFLSSNWDQINSLDFLTLGANTDAPITFEPIYNMRMSGVFLRPYDQHPSQSRIDEILTSYSHTDVALFTVHKMFGTCAFMVSPKGAEELLTKAFPLDETPIEIPLLRHRLLGISFDRRMNSILEELKAKMCLPFLALTPNDSKSQR